MSNNPVIRPLRLPPPDLAQTGDENLATSEAAVEWLHKHKIRLY